MKTNKPVLEAARFALSEMQRVGADEASVSATRSTVSEIYYESGKISMLRTLSTDALTLKYLKEKKKGTAALTSFAPDLISEAAADAALAASNSESDEAEGIAELTENLDLCRGILKPDLDPLYQFLEQFLQTVHSDYPKIVFDSISVSHGYSDAYILNSAGVEQHEESGFYSYSMMYMAKDGDAISSFNGYGGVFIDFETPLMDCPGVREHLRQTEEQIYTEPFEGKIEGDIILVPECSAEFLSYVDDLFLSDAPLIDGTSLLKDSLGDLIASPLLTWASDPKAPELLAASPFTGEGYPAEHKMLIEKGFLKSFSLSRYGAKRSGRERSANCSADYVVAAGQTPLEDMIASVRNGLLLCRFSGGNPAPSGDLTGVAKNSYIIENGRIKAPVSEAMISLNLKEMLLNITAISAERLCQGSMNMPWIKVEKVTISGKA